MSTSSHYNNRNLSPQPGALHTGMISKVAPSSGGYMGQGLTGIVGRLEPEANSTSFYSINSSANLSNSRYLIKPRDNKVGPPSNIGKVMPPMMKSIDQSVVYGSHTSHFPNHDNSYPLSTN